MGAPGPAGGPLPASLTIPDALPQGDDLPALLGFRYPGGEAVGAAAAVYAGAPRWDGREGPQAFLVIAPGSLRIERHDLNRAERTRERAVQRRLKGEPSIPEVDADDSELPHDAPDWAEPDEVIAERLARVPALELAPPKPRGTIREWSRSSQAMMTRALSALDWTPLLPGKAGMPGMLTLTLPDEWLALVPSAKAWKRLVGLFLKRYERAWGHPLVGCWKDEFQERGAPHRHFMTLIPRGIAYGHLIEGATPTRARVWEALDANLRTRGSNRPAGAGLPFEAWARAAWADIVAAPDPRERAKHAAHGVSVDLAEGMRMKNPALVGIYFRKHAKIGKGSKDYQNHPPREWAAQGSVGRFWGILGLRRAEAFVSVDDARALFLQRTIRRMHEAQGRTRGVKVERGVNARTGQVRTRTVHRRVRRMRSYGGFLAVPDGPGLAFALARALEAAGLPAGKVATS